MTKKFFNLCSILLILLCALSCNFQPKAQMTNTSIAIPATLLRSISINEYAEYYIEYTVSYDETIIPHTEKIDLAVFNTDSPYTLQIVNIPFDKLVTIHIEITEELATTAEKTVLFRGEGTENFSDNNNKIQITLAKVNTSDPTEPTNPTGTIEPITTTNYLVGDLILIDGTVIRYDEENCTTENYAQYIDRAVAVIFKATDGENPALGVGVKQTYCHWEKSSTNSKAFNVLNYTQEIGYLSGHIDGSESWGKMNNSYQNGLNLEDYPVFDFAENYPTVYYQYEDGDTSKALTKYIRESNYLYGTMYEKGWYLPTVAECSVFNAELKSIVNDVLTALGAEAPTSDGKYKDFYNNSVQMITGDWYWTSNSQSAGKASYYAFGNFAVGSHNRIQSNDDTFYVLAIRKFY